MDTIKKIITTKYILKIASFILGFSFWYILSQSRPIEISYTVPLTFYGKNCEKLEADETITLRLKGYKSDFYSLDLKELAAHINSDQFIEGKNYITIHENNLFLPQSIKLLDCTPSNVVVIVKKNT